MLFSLDTGIIYPLALYDLTRTFERPRLVLHRRMTITELSQCLKIMVPSARGNSSYCQYPFMFVSWVMPYGVVCQSRNSCRVYAISFRTGTFLPTLSKVRRSICTDHDTSQACLFEHASRRGNAHTTKKVLRKEMSSLSGAKICRGTRVFGWHQARRPSTLTKHSTD
jgi:hypothetical protein